MDKTRRDLFFALVLVIVFLFSLARNVVFHKKPPPAKNGQTSQGLVDTVNHLAFLGWAKRSDALFDAQQAVWAKAWGRDPFFDEQTLPGLQAGGLVLSGIVWDSKKPIAMVNEDVLTVGDTIAGYTVKQIKPGSVIFTADGQDVEIPLFDPSEKSK